MDIELLTESDLSLLTEVDEYLIYIEAGYLTTAPPHTVVVSTTPIPATSVPTTMAPLSHIGRRLTVETYVGDIIRISLITNIVLTGLITGIKYKKPDGTLGQWAASIDITDNTKMYYDTLVGELDQSGQWQLQAFAYIGVTERGHGRIVELKVIDPLTVRVGLTTPAPTTPTPTTTPL